jgi:hypothetical protein
MQADRAAINELVARADHNWIFQSREVLTAVLQSAGELSDKADPAAVDAALKEWMQKDPAALEQVLQQAQDKGYQIHFTRMVQPRSVTILTYALCGFSNFSSIGIQIGGLGAMAPERQSDFARLGLKAMICGALATCMTACVAGILI